MHYNSIAALWKTDRTDLLIVDSISARHRYDRDDPLRRTVLSVTNRKSALRFMYERTIIVTAYHVHFDSQNHAPIIKNVGQLYLYRLRLRLNVEYVLYALKPLAQYYNYVSSCIIMYTYSINFRRTRNKLIRFIRVVERPDGCYTSRLERYTIMITTRRWRTIFIP
jgi:hypothetical protein